MVIPESGSQIRVFWKAETEGVLKVAHTLPRCGEVTSFMFIIWTATTILIRVRPHQEKEATSQEDNPVNRRVEQRIRLNEEVDRPWVVRDTFDLYGGARAAH